MKVIAIRDAKQTLSGCVENAQHESVLITQHGKPAAILVGVRGYDLEDVMLMRDPKFWEMIQARRREATSYSLDEVREHFGLPASRPAADVVKARPSEKPGTAVQASLPLLRERRHSPGKSIPLESNRGPARKGSRAKPADSPPAEAPKKARRRAARRPPT